MNEPISIARERAALPSGDTLAYAVHGTKRSPEDPVILLLHGYCGSSAYWEDTLPLLAGAGRFVVPDLRGHGLSSAPKEDVYDMSDMARDIAQLLDALGERRAVLLGHSLGGYITLAFAEAYPDRLAGFGLVHSTPLPDSDEAKANRERAARTIRDEGITTFVGGLVPKLFAEANRESMRDKVERALAIGRGTSPSGAAATALGMKARPDRSFVLRESSLPVLLVAGRGDQVVAPERTFAAEGSGARRVVIEDAGHMSMMETPAELAHAIASFAEAASHDVR